MSILDELCAEESRSSPTLPESVECREAVALKLSTSPRPTLSEASRKQQKYEYLGEREGRWENTLADEKTLWSDLFWDSV